MELPKFIIGILLFVVIIFAGVNFVADINNNYSSVNTTAGMNTSVSGLTRITDRSNNISNDATSIKNKIFSDTDVSTTDTISSLVKGGWEALKLTGSSIAMSVDMVGVVSDETSGLGISPLFWNMLIAVLLILAIFAIIYLIFSLTGGA